MYEEFSKFIPKYDIDIASDIGGCKKENLDKKRVKFIDGVKDEIIYILVCAVGFSHRLKKQFYFITVEIVFI